MDKVIKKNVKSKDGTNLYYEVYATTKSHPVLFFVHGVGGDLDAWQYVKNNLFEKGFSSIAMDLRGHGKSDHPSSSKQYELDNFIEDVITVLDIEKIDKVILIGHSLGAVLVTHVALRHQERIEKLIIISSSYIPPSYFKIPGIFLLINTLAMVSLPPLSGRHSIYPLGKHHKDIEAFGLIRTIIRNSLRSYILSSKEILKLNMGASLKGIGVPTLIISGAKDSIFPTKISEYIHSQIPQSQLKIIPGANHVVILNNIKETTDYICDFLIKNSR